MDDVKKTATNLNESLKETKYEIELLIRSIDQKRTEFTEIVTKQIKELNTQIKSLEKETVILHTLPKKLTTQINESIPNIAIELDRLNQRQLVQLKEAHKNSVEDQNNAIKDAALRLKQIKEEIEQIDGKRIKRYFLGLGITVLISVLSSLGASYVMIEKFPHRVHIESPKKVMVEKSDVSLWGSKNLNVSGEVKQRKRGR